MNDLHETLSRSAGKSLSNIEVAMDNSQFGSAADFDDIVKEQVAVTDTCTMYIRVLCTPEGFFVILIQYC